MKMADVVMAVLVGACLAALPLACAEEDKDGGNPGNTPTVTPASTATPPAKVPGITDTEILLGQHQTLSGSLGAIYSMLPKAQEAYYSYVNDTQGGVCGRKIVLKVEDDAGDPAEALVAARKLVEQEKVFAFVGNAGGPQHTPVWEHLNEIGVPDLLVAGGVLKYYSDPQGYPWTTSALPDFTIEGRFFGDYISRYLPGKNVGILIPNNDFGWDALAGIKDVLDAEKNPIVSEQSYELTDIDVRSQIMKIENAGAEVLILGTALAQTGQAIKAAERIGWHPDMFTSYVNSDQILFQMVSPELAEGLITFQVYQLAHWTDVPAVAKHQEIMRDYGGPAPSNFTIFSQVLAETAVEVLSRACDNLTREGLMEAMESLDGWRSDLLIEGVTFTTSDTDHLTLEAGRMLRVVVKDGKGDFEYFGPLFVFEGGEVKVYER
jgi:branched-chain amino acid transport system substrate-binding protein